MLNIPPHMQTRSFCGPASLKMVLRYYGVRKSETLLAQWSGASRERGASAKGLLKAARVAGLDGYIKDRATLADLRSTVQRRRIPVIVDWFSGAEGHYSPVVDIRTDRIMLQDPEIGRRRTLDLVTFKRVWFDFPGPYIRSQRDIILRRMIVIAPKEHLS